jgi:hypothetical protein
MLKHCAVNRKKRLSVLPIIGAYTTLNLWPYKELHIYVYIYIYDISRLRAKILAEFDVTTAGFMSIQFVFGAVGRGIMP